MITETMNIKRYLHPKTPKKINDLFHPNCATTKEGKLTDGEATLGGMRVEILRRKIRDMANTLGLGGVMMFVQEVVMGSVAYKRYPYPDFQRLIL